MSRGTKLYQAAGSPLIQGRSRLQRPWWQPLAGAVAAGVAWPWLTILPMEVADSNRAGIGAALAETLRTWVSGLPILLPAVLVGAAIGVTLAGAWGFRHRWLVGTIGGVGVWYAALVVVGLLGR